MNGYMTRFTRRDGKPREEYYYFGLKEAIYHMNLFKDDDSSLYTKVEVIDLKNMKQISALNYQ